MKYIYCVEDDASIRNLICYTLDSTGFIAEGFESATDFFSKAAKKLPDLILLDLMLPELDGMQILKKLRSDSKTQKIPVIILSAKGDRLDKIKGLDCGADDYITKPFDILELISRIKAVLRRSSPVFLDDTIKYSNIYVNLSSHQVFIEDKEILLTYKEYELLKFLILNKGKVMSRSVLMDKIWGFDFEGETRTVDVHIRTLRQKLGEDGRYIETVRNVGYRMSDNV